MIKKIKVSEELWAVIVQMLYAWAETAKHVNTIRKMGEVSAPKLTDILDLLVADDMSKFDKLPPVEVLFAADKLRIELEQNEQ